MIGGEHYLPCIEAYGNLANVIHGIWNCVEYRGTGRDAIHSLVSHISAPRLWLPDYLCESIYRPIRDLGVSIKFYHVDLFDLRGANWEEMGEEGDCIFLIHYFGTPQLRALEILRSRNITTISDVTHAMLNISALRQIGVCSDYSVSSLRKTAALPDGAFVASPRFKLPVASQPPREQFWTLRAAALLSRGGSAADSFLSDENFQIFRNAEQCLERSCAGDHAMSDCSQFLLATLPWHEWSAKTAMNHARFKVLLNGIGDETGTTAGAHLYPVLLESKQKRDRVREELRNKGIIAPIHWDTNFLEQPHWISDRMISLPCDYRYSESQIEHSAKTFLEAL